MKEYQQRVIEEKKELDEKIVKLKDFMHSDDSSDSKCFKDLDSVNQGLMMVQLVAMENYSNALARRIEIF